MGSDIPVLLLTVYYCCCLVTQQRVAAAGCSPTFPEESPRRSAQAAGTEGLQVFVPSYAFTCNGLITSVLIGADGNSGGDDGFVFQIWRPNNDGTFALIQSIDTSGSTQRISVNKLNFTASIPVLSGDTIGYRLQPVAQGTEMHFLLDNSNASLGVEILTRSTSEVVCHLSPCDSLYTTRADSAPFISVQFEEGETAVVNLEDPVCSTQDVPPCRALDSLPSTSSLPPTTSPSPSPPVITTTTGASPSPPSVNRDTSGDSGIVGTIAGVASLLLVAMVSTVVIHFLILLRVRQRRRKIPQLTDNVAYNIHDHNTNKNEACGTVDNDVVATTNPAYGTTSGSGERDIPTATNEAYIPTTCGEIRKSERPIDTSTNAAYVSTTISTADNPAYGPVEDNRTTSTLVYDYVAT